LGGILGGVMGIYNGIFGDDQLGWSFSSLWDSVVSAGKTVVDVGQKALVVVDGIVNQYQTIRGMGNELSKLPIKNQNAASLQLKLGWSTGNVQGLKGKTMEYKTFNNPIS
jgi:hypothetical protein